MRAIILLFITMVLFGACSPAKKTPPKSTSPPVTRADLLKGGTSFDNAIVIRVETERAGLDEEYKWLANSYPGYALVRRSHVVRSSRHYDIVRIRTKDRQVKDIYFDSTSFWGRN